MSELQKQACASFVKAQKEFAPALKQSTNPHFRSKYVDLAGCVEAVIDALNSNGLALQQFSHERDGGVAIETRLIHESGEVIDCGVLFVPASKQDAQGYGSALTYARRYSLMAACGIAPEDDDGNKATKSAPIKTKSLKFYPQENFELGLPKWKENKEPSVDLIKRMAENNYQFTPSQLEIIDNELAPF